MHKFTITPKGPFSLKESAEFGFGQRHSTPFEGVMRMAFCLDDYRKQVGVAISQDEEGVVHCTMQGSDDIAAVKQQVARVLSLDHDGVAFTEVGKRDPIIGKLQQVAPGLRPPLFYSPYEAAVWAIISTRRMPRVMMEVRRKLSETHGKSFEVAGQTIAALPLPNQLLKLSSFPGIPDERFERLHAIAQAALDGKLNVAYLKSMDPETAMEELQQLKGIGPFYSALIVVRATGLADVLTDEPTGRELASQLYGFDHTLSYAKFADLAEQWRPFRTWALVLIRAAAKRLPQS
jgi:DNA-3-methyladenine glycosylase II